MEEEHELKKTLEISKKEAVALQHERHKMEEVSGAAVRLCVRTSHCMALTNVKSVP